MLIIIVVLFVKDLFVMFLVWIIKVYEEIFLWLSWILVEICLFLVEILKVELVCMLFGFNLYFILVKVKEFVLEVDIYSIVVFIGSFLWMFVW